VGDNFIARPSFSQYDTRKRSVPKAEFRVATSLFGIMIAFSGWTLLHEVGLVGWLVGWLVGYRKTTGVGISQWYSAGRWAG
jgi:hypothetical protein